jgi:hypothetical protein
MEGSTTACTNALSIIVRLPGSIEQDFEFDHQWWRAAEQERSRSDASTYWLAEHHAKGAIVEPNGGIA